MLNLSQVSYTGNTQLGYVDQLLLPVDSKYPAYLSVYGYANALEGLKPRKTDNQYNREYEILELKGENLRYRFYNGAFGTYNSDKATCMHSRITRIPDSDYTQLLNYTDPEEYNTNLPVYKISYFQLAPLLDFVRKQSRSFRQKEVLRKQLYQPGEELKACLLACPEVHKAVYKLIERFVNIPFMEEWVPYCLSRVGIKVFLPLAMYADLDNPNNIYMLSFSFDVDALLKTVQEGLARKYINIKGSNWASPSNKSLDSLTAYMEQYSEQLIDKAAAQYKAHFDPKVHSFSPKEQRYFAYSAYKEHFQFYDAQKNVIGAVNRAFQKSRNVFVIGECGSGKTDIAIGALYCNAKRKGFNACVLAPGHLVQKWQREIERLYPGAKAVIINSLERLLALSREIKQQDRPYPLFMILSKDLAKLSYTERPAVLWDSHRKLFRCPCCGAEQFMISRRKKLFPIGGQFGVRESLRTQYDIATAVQLFLEKDSLSAFCNTIHPLRSTRKGRVTKDKTSCGNTLWSSTHSGDSSKWFKYPGLGYLHEDMLEPYKAWYLEAKENNTEITALQHRIYRAVLDIEENGRPKAVAARRFSLARYIREHFHGQLDYLICDEVHQYSGLSAQANAFGDLASVAKRTLALTGTLLNGYATGIYYILFRLYSRSFRSRGYTYDNLGPFVHKYGVHKESYTFDSNGHQVRKAPKFMPGVSPELFADFLQDKCAFISLADISKGLPDYQEIPVAVPMEQETAKHYAELTNQVRHMLEDGKNKELAFLATHKLNIYPDMPYNVAPIYDKNNYPLLKFPNAVARPEQYISNKDLKCLELVQESLAKGDRVLIYVNYIHKTDCAFRLQEILTQAGIKCCILEASVKAVEREQWIAKQLEEGCQVMLCSPELVATGLDLQLPTIIYYQLGYNLFTLRQSSRRSLRLNMTRDVTVYFLYYEKTLQEMVLSLMAAKMMAAMSIEAKFSEEGLVAMNTNNEDLLTQLASNLVKRIECRVDSSNFASSNKQKQEDAEARSQRLLPLQAPKPYEAVLMVGNKKTSAFSLDAFLQD